MILALETSCDDTCAAVIDAQGAIRSNVISSQGVHDRYGGVVPEIASRHHLHLIGDGAVEFRSVLERSGASVPGDDSQLHRVSAINHCRLAGTQEPADPGEVLPDYLRVPDAELTRRAKSSP